MPNKFDRNVSEAFVRAAQEREILSDDEASDLLHRATTQLVSPSQLALQSQLMSQIEVEIAEAFVAPEDLAPGYKLLDVLGYGALGVVYRASQSRLKRDVAIKAILQNRLSQQNVLARFEQEGAVIGRLNHPNIVRAFDSGSHQGRVYLVMEFVQGSDLRHRLQSGPMPVATGMSIVRQTAAGLSHALSFGVIHRDIKPGNLILTEAPAGFDLPSGVPLVKIADFGLARFHRVSELDEPDETDTQLTMAGATLGTPMYSAPEQLTGDDVDHRADIYGLGATLFQILSGETPFESSTVSKMMAKKITGEPPRLEMLPSHVGREAKLLLDDMMANDPEERIPNYETLIERIDEIQSPVNGKRGAFSPSSSGRGNSRGWMKWIAAVLLISPIAGYAFWSSRSVHTASGREYIESTWTQPLHDGETLTGWGSSAGERIPNAKDAEDGTVFRLDGWTSRSIPLPPDDPTTSYVLQFNVDLLESESAEIHFGFQAVNENVSLAQSESGSRLVARVSRESAVLGSRTSLNDDLVVLDEPAPPPRFKGMTPEYHTVRVELTDQSHWAFFLDGKRIGQTVAIHAQQQNLLQLVAQDGPVHFEGMYVSQLIPKPESSP